MISNIALIGMAGSGKDFLAAHLVKELQYTRVAFADPLRRTCAAIFDLDEWQSDELKDTIIPKYGKSARQIWLDMSATIRSIDNDIWINQTVDEISEYDKVIISDCRTENEMKVLRDLGFTFIWITRLDNPKEPNSYDIENTAKLKHLVDYYYDNSYNRDLRNLINFIESIDI